MSAIEDLINNVVDQDFSKAGPMFTDIIQSKMNDALEQEKINVAAEIYNDGNAIEPATDDTEVEQDLEMGDEELDDVTDEEIEAAIDELDDEPTEYEFDEEES